MPGFGEPRRRVGDDREVEVPVEVSLIGWRTFLEVAARGSLSAAAVDTIAGTTVLNLATVAPGEAVELAAIVHAAGARYVHAPVIGSVPAMVTGDLTILAGGASLPEDARAVLTHLGEIVELGSVAEAAAAKLAANAALAGAALAARGAAARSEELGLEPDTVWSLLERTPLGPLIRGKRERLDRGCFRDADFTVAALVKDLRLLAQIAPGGAGLAAAFEDLLSSTSVSPVDDIGAVLLAPPSTSWPHGLSIDPGVSVAAVVLEPLIAYVAGHATADPRHHRRAFLSTAHIEGVRSGEFTSWDLEEFCGLFDARPAEDEAQRRRRIDDVHVTGSVATATMRLWHGADTFTDSFLLVRVGDEWRIANKAYHRHEE